MVWLLAFPRSLARLLLAIYFHILVCPLQVNCLCDFFLLLLHHLRILISWVARKNERIHLIKVWWNLGFNLLDFRVCYNSLGTFFVIWLSFLTFVDLDLLVGLIDLFSWQTIVYVQDWSPFYCDQHVIRIITAIWWYMNPLITFG